MKILAISAFDPASVVLSHRDLMRAQGHDFRLAVVRAYTERQRQADYVIEQLVYESAALAPGISTRRARWEKLSPNLDDLRAFAESADVIQFHPGIGMGDGDWASRGGYLTINLELLQVEAALGLVGVPYRGQIVHFFHGSKATWANKDYYRDCDMVTRAAASTIDYAHEFDCAYLPPLVDVGDLHAPLRGDDDPLMIAHTPTDRNACSTEEFLAAARGLGILVRLGEGLTHKQVLTLKAECNAGFDHMRGAFSVNTLENAALGLVPLFAWDEQYLRRAEQEGFEPPIQHPRIHSNSSLASVIGMLDRDPEYTRWCQASARQWWETYFSAEPITRRLVKFYEGL